MEEDTRTALLRTASSWTDWMMVDNLKKFTWYLIQVVGFSDQGSSVSSEVIRVLTLEDVPSAPPSAAIVHDMRDTSTIDIRWSTVPPEHRNGIILGYKLTCRENAEQDEDDSNSLVFSKTYILSASTTKFTLHNLNSSTSYLFELLAYTSKGDGVEIKLTGATCNCEREVYTNWYEYPPYVSKDDTGIPGGIFGPLIKDMILTACGECPNGHGRSVLSFSDNGKGDPANKHSQYDVINDIDDVTDVSFPVRGYVGDTKFMKYYTYVSLLESPGTAFLTVRKDEATSRNDALYSTLSDCWPVIILAFSMALLAGILIWFLECSSNPEQFPPLFYQGAWEGLWFCYISMTTVGYGDRAPVTVLARILTFVWILTGLLIISICMGLIAYSLTVVVASLEKQVILYGTKVSAVENSTEYRIGLLKNAKMHAYPSLTSSYQALGNGEVDGVLVDACVAGSLQDITSVNTYVNRIIDSGSYTYGVVLSGKVVRLQKACSQYIQSNRAIISHWIKKNIKPLQSSPAVVSNTSEPSAHVVNQHKSSISAWDVIIVLLVVLGVCTFFGLVWEAYLRLKIQKEDKIKQDMERRRACLHQVVKEFYDNCNTTWSKLRRKHVKELETFCNLNKGKGSISKS
ncbi:uncharacterized protein LOC116290266 [Actinia tenebrosa]|uniref:Uncharacterized protein LOC116290266 n=1 Tax=Actinia tenebrosa TaxID=6105 RepID=A0A6P8HDJ6_ACTTE|nr:uncharacterized protein LOC116290266 [Actinia tenebrosa]